jgi:hypothetical protein
MNGDAPCARATRRPGSTQQRAIEQFRAVAEPYRLRVRTDIEGFPIIPGRYGQIEWFDGAELAVYTHRPRLFARLWAIPGVRRHQTDDTEMRAVFPLEALVAVATVIRARRRRTQAAPRSLGNLRPRTTSGAAEATSPNPPSADTRVADTSPGE